MSQIEFQDDAAGVTRGVSVASPLPTIVPDVLTSGTITAINGNVEITTAGRDTASIQVTGTYTGVLSLQATIDGTNWVTLAGLAVTNVATGVQTATIASAAVGIFQAGVGSWTKFRVIALAAVTGTATVTIRTTDGNALVALDAPLPTGTNSIGVVAPANGLYFVTAPYAGTGGGLTTAATTNATVIKGSQGNLYETAISNLTAATIYVKFYNKSTAPSVGTDVPIAVYGVAAGATLSVEFGVIGKRFSAGISLATTAAAAVTDTTAITAGAIIHNTYM